MDNIQIVIDISKEKYNQIINRYKGSNVRPKDYEIAIINGTPLPKGHGRLIDVSEYFKKEFGDAREFLDKATTIIEADKEESEE